jgi:hypothetical protein
MLIIQKKLHILIEIFFLNENKFISLSKSKKKVMIKKTQKTTINSLKKSLHEIKECLNESVPNLNKKETVGLKFSRVGTRYQIEDSPIPPSDSIGLQLERSFNNFMRNLDVNYSGVKLEGSMVLTTKIDMFMVGYNNYIRKGKKITKSSHSIDGML